MGKELLAELDPVISLNTQVPCSAAFPHPSGFGTEEAHKEGRTNEQPFTGPPQLPSFPGSHSSNMVCRRATFCIYYLEFRKRKIKKKKSKELIPLVPCCVGGDAVKDKGSIPDVTWVPHILSLPLGWLCYMSPKLGQETSPASPSLLHPGFLPPHSSPSPDYAEGPSCTHNSSTRDSSSPADFSWALLVSLKTLFCSHHLSQPASCASSA